MSIEPVIIPEQSLAMIEKSALFVDEFKIGKLNYHQEAKKINWQKFSTDAMALLKKLNKQFS